MAFWGVELKPGKPVTHSCEKSRSSLRLTQATLGNGASTKKTVFLQCNVGNKSPVFLCALLPDKTESCRLDLEFSGADDVVFSVIGPRTVYLTGYFVHTTRHSIPHTDSESYGMNIERSPTVDSNYLSDDDDDDDDDNDNDDGNDSFIDDRELQVSPPSPHDAMDNKPARRRLQRKFQIVESDSDMDGYTLSALKKKLDEKKPMAKSQQADVQGAEIVVVPDTDSDEDKYLFSGLRKKNVNHKTLSKT